MSNQEVKIKQHRIENDRGTKSQTGESHKERKRNGIKVWLNRSGEDIYIYEIETFLQEATCKYEWLESLGEEKLLLVSVNKVSLVNFLEW